MEDIILIDFDSKCSLTFRSLIRTLLLDSSNQQHNKLDQTRSRGACINRSSRKNVYKIHKRYHCILIFVRDSRFIRKKKNNKMPTSTLH